MKTFLIIATLVCLRASATFTILNGTDANGVGVAAYYDDAATNANSRIALWTHGLGNLKNAPIAPVLSPTFVAKSNWTVGVCASMPLIIVASDAESDNGFGQPLELRDYTNLVTWATNHFPFAQWNIVIGESMGGVSMGICSQAPNVTHTIDFYGIVNLAWAYGGGSGPYQSGISTAYGIPGSGSYATLTAGHDPMLFNGNVWSGKRLLAFHSPSDTAVNYNSNSVALTNLALPSASAAQLVTTSGDHGDDSNFTNTVQTAVDFLKAVNSFGDAAPFR